MDNKEKIMLLQLVHVLDHEKINDSTVSMKWRGFDEITLMPTHSKELYSNGFIIKKDPDRIRFEIKRVDSDESMVIDSIRENPIGLQIYSFFNGVVRNYYQLEKSLKQKFTPILVEDNVCSYNYFRITKPWSDRYFEVYIDDREFDVNEDSQIFSAIKEIFENRFKPVVNVDDFVNIDFCPRGIEDFYTKKRMIKRFCNIIKCPKDKVFNSIDNVGSCFDKLGNENFRFQKIGDVIYLYDIKNKLSISFNFSLSSKIVQEFIECLFSIGERNDNTSTFNE